MGYRRQARESARELAAAKANLEQAQSRLSALESANRETPAPVPVRYASRPAPAAAPSDSESAAAASAATPPSPGPSAPADAAGTAPVRTQDLRQARTTWMENFRQQNPQAYEDMQKRMQEAQARIQNAFAQKADYFQSRDTSGMSDDDLADYNRMLALLDQTWKLAALMQTDLPRDQRHEAADAVRSNMFELTPLMLEERAREFQDYAIAMGLSSKDAATFATNMTAIIDATTLQNLFRGLMRGPFGRGADPSRPPPPP